MRIMTLAFTVIILAACQAGDLDANDLPTAELPPPTFTDIWTGNVVTGSVVELVIEGANPNDTLVLAGSLAGIGAGPCPPVFGGTCLDLVRPVRLDDVVADADGRIRHRLTMPPRLSGETIHFQAIGGGWINSYTTFVVSRTIQRSPPTPVNLGYTRPPIAPFDTESIEIEGDTLFVDVSYGGGCADHEFVAEWSGLFLESFPVQTGIQLYKRPVFDPCDAIVEETLRFDLRQIRVEAGLGPVLIDVLNEQLTYEFL
jgi:hypothetical protein